MLKVDLDRDILALSPLYQLKDDMEEHNQNMEIKQTLTTASKIYRERAHTHTNSSTKDTQARTHGSNVGP
eukprot:4231326-Amphidinium_carterae.1